MVKFPLKFFYNIGVILENLEFPHFCLDFLQKKFYNIDRYVYYAYTPQAWQRPQKSSPLAYLKQT